MRAHPLTTSSTALFAFLTLGTAFAADPQTAVAPESPFAEIGRWFEAHPELQDRSGTGWKPYNRIKWFHERRMDGGTLPPGDARWRAWEEKRRRETAMGPSARSTWFALGPANFGGRMLAIDFDATNPSIVYAGAAGGGVFKSTDAGLSWTAVSDGIPSLGVGALAVSRTNPNVVVIGTGEGTLNIDRVLGVGILRSTDAGATWQTTNLSYAQVTAHGFHFATAGPSGTLLAGAVDGMFRSVDDGATWTEVMPTVGSTFANGWYDAQWDPADPNRVYAVKGNDSTTNGVYVSTDDGLTWAIVGTGQPAAGSFGKCKLGVSGDNVYCYVGSPGFGGGVFGLIRSTDDGANWVQAVGTGLPSGQSWYNLSCVADPNNSARVICGAVIFARSSDLGDTFVEVGSNVHVDHHALKYEPGSNGRVWACSDGGVWFSATDGSLFSWQDRNAGLVSYQFYDICVNNGADPYYVMGGTQDNGTDKWSGTTTWADGLGADGMVCNVDPTNGTTVYAEIQNGGHNKSLDSGASFFSIGNGITGSGRWVTPVDEDQTDGDRLFTETSTGVFRTTDGGANWSNVTSSRAVWISISSIDPQIVWTTNGGTTQRSTDGGDTWNVVAAFPFSIGGSTKVYAHPADVSTAFVCFSSYSNVVTLARTTDDGGTWTDVTGDLPLIPVNGIAIHPAAPDDWYIATDLGVWHSGNGGVNWLPYATGLPNVVVEDVEIKLVPGKLVAGTHGRGAWEIDLGLAVGVETDVAVEPAARNLMFDEPWPNPAKDRTLLRYAAKSAGAVTLRIYDVRGRLVSSLEGFSRGDGIIRTTPWFPDDVANGVYLAVLEAGGERVTRKITVLK
ncbi:MAG: T9SS type A sorting domain-containing protein [Candidatus Eiseniibacteriota bacterium]